MFNVVVVSCVVYSKTFLHRRKLIKINRINKWQIDDLIQLNGNDRIDLHCILFVWQFYFRYKTVEVFTATHTTTIMNNVSTDDDADDDDLAFASYTQCRDLND